MLCHSSDYDVSNTGDAIVDSYAELCHSSDYDVSNTDFQEYRDLRELCHSSDYDVSNTGRGSDARSTSFAIVQIMM